MLRSFMLALSLFGFASLRAHAESSATQAKHHEKSEPASDENSKAPTEASPPKVTLSTEEQYILNEGPISTGQQVAGGILAYVVGFGVGHAVEGMYGKSGIVFTIGDTVLLILLVKNAVSWGDRVVAGQSIANTSGDATIYTLIGFGVFRLIEVIDAIWRPISYNNQYNEIKSKADGGRLGFSIEPNLFVTKSEFQLGLTAHF